MIEDARRLLHHESAALVRDAAGLAGLCVIIVAALFLPLLA